MRRSRKPLWGRLHRGFESPPLRILSDDLLRAVMGSTITAKKKLDKTHSVCILISIMPFWKDYFVGRLGKPYFEAEKCLIYNLDCIDALRFLDSEIIDLTITSPPYNIGKAYENVLHLDDYLDWSSKWINEVYRVTKPTGAFWLNLGYVSIPHKARAIPLPYLIWDKVPFHLMQEIVWNYGAGVVVTI